MFVLFQLRHAVTESKFLLLSKVCFVAEVLFVVEVLVAVEGGHRLRTVGVSKRKEPSHPISLECERIFTRLMCTALASSFQLIIRICPRSRHLFHDRAH